MKSTRKIRIMHVAQAAGGVDKYLQCLIKYLDHYRFENICVCSQDYKAEDYCGIVEAFEKVNMQRAIGGWDIKATGSVRKLIKKYKPDIVYAHSSKAGVIARMANIGISSKCIYNPHGWSFNMKGSIVKQMVYTVIERIMAFLCDKIVCISEAEKQSALIKEICAENKLHIIFNGVDVEQYDRSEHNKILRKDIGITDEAFVVGMVGRLCKQKAPDIFIKMAKQIVMTIPNAYFLMVGDGDMRGEIEKYAEKYGILDHVYVTGWVDNPLSYVELFDVAVLLSRWEGFGLAIPEYMMCKKPVVATAVDAIPNIVIDHLNGLLVPMDNPDAASNAVIEIYNDFHLKNKLIMQGVQDVHEKFNARRVSEEHELLFYQIMSDVKR